MKQADKNNSNNPLKTIESEFSKRIKELHERISRLENILDNKLIRSKNEFNYFQEVKEAAGQVEFHLQQSKKVLKGKIQWLDSYNICIDEEKEGEIVIPKHSILYHKIV